MQGKDYFKVRSPCTNKITMILTVVYIIALSSALTVTPAFLVGSVGVGGRTAIPVIYMVLVVVVMCFFTMAKVRSPIFNKTNYTHNTSRLNNYCYICRLAVTEDTQHCLICDRCIDRFDHHCVYLDSCIGRQNYQCFLFFIGSMPVIGLYTVAVSVYYIVIMTQHGQYVLLAFPVLGVVVSVFPIYFSVYLSFYHSGLRRLRLTTYYNILRVDSLREQGKLSRREAYAIKKCICTNTKHAVALTACCYREAADSDALAEQYPSVPQSGSLRLSEYPAAHVATSYAGDPPVGARPASNAAPWRPLGAVDLRPVRKKIRKRARRNTG